MGKGSNGLDPAVQSGMLANQTALVDIAQGQAANAKTLFDLTEPGLVSAEQFYQKLNTGDPQAIFQATAPVAQQASEAGSGAKANILASAPAGGERNLALEAVDANKANIVSKAAAGSYLSSPNALGQLAGQGVGESTAAASAGISGYNAANQGLSSLGGLQIEEQKVQAEEKGNVLGAIGGVASDAAEVGSAFA